MLRKGPGLVTNNKYLAPQRLVIRPHFNLGDINTINPGEVARFPEPDSKFCNYQEKSTAQPKTVEGGVTNKLGKIVLFH